MSTRHEDKYKEGQVWQDNNGEQFRIELVERIQPRDGGSYVVLSLRSLDRRGGKLEYPETLKDWSLITL